MDRTSESSTSSIPNAEQVVASLKTSGTLEKLRMLAIERLEHDEALRQRVQSEVLQSRVFKQFTGDKSRPLIPQLIQELSGDLSRDACEALWRVLSEPAHGGGISHLIDDAARQALCQLHAERLHQGGGGNAAQQHNSG